MSISAIASSIFSPQQTGSASSSCQKQIQQLSQDLQSGNLTAAQSDFASLQQAFSQPSATTTSATASNPIAQAFSQLGSALQSGNLSAAQKDFATVQQDIQSQVASHFHHHGHGGGGGGGGDSNIQASQSYALQQQLEQFAFGGGALSTQASALQDQPPLSLVA